MYSVGGDKPRIKSNGLQRPYKGSQTMEKKTIVIGQMSNERDHTLESANRVYGNKGCCPTINTCGGGNLQPKVIKQVNVIGGTGDLWGDKQYRQQHRVVDKKQVAYAVTAELMNNAVVKHYESRNKTSNKGRIH